MSQKNVINSALIDFEKYPDCAHIRLPTVRSLLGISTATVWRLVKSQKLQSYKITTRTTTFNVGEVRALLLSVRGGNHHGKQ